MPARTATQSSALTEKELQSIETFHRAFTDHNPDLLDGVCTPDWQDIPLAPGQGPGPEGLKDQIVAVFLKALPDLEIVVHEIVGSPGRAGVRASITGTHLEEVMGVPATGPYTMVLIDEVADGGWGRADETLTLAKMQAGK